MTLPKIKQFAPGLLAVRQQKKALAVVIITTRGESLD